MKKLASGTVLIVFLCFLLLRPILSAGAKRPLRGREAPANGTKNQKYPKCAPRGADSGGPNLTTGNAISTELLPFKVLEFIFKKTSKNQQPCVSPRAFWSLQCPDNDAQFVEFELFLYFYNFAIHKRPWGAPRAAELQQQTIEICNARISLGLRRLNINNLLFGRSAESIILFVVDPRIWNVRISIGSEVVVHYQIDKIIVVLRQSLGLHF